MYGAKKRRGRPRNNEGPGRKVAKPLEGSESSTSAVSDASTSALAEEFAACAVSASNAPSAGPPSGGQGAAPQSHAHLLEDENDEDLSAILVNFNRSSSPSLSHLLNDENDADLSAFVENLENGSVIREEDLKLLSSLRDVLQSNLEKVQEIRKQKEATLVSLKATLTLSNNLAPTNTEAYLKEGIAKHSLNQHCQGSSYISEKVAEFKRGMFKGKGVYDTLDSVHKATRHAVESMETSIIALRKAQREIGMKLHAVKRLLNQFTPMH